LLFGHAGQDHEPAVTDYHRPCADQSGKWCQWEPSEDGVGKFYYSLEWMTYLIDIFLAPGARLAGELTSPMEPRVPVHMHECWSLI
jgi:hypothetical protein